MTDQRQAVQLAWWTDHPQHFARPSGGSTLRLLLPGTTDRCDSLPWIYPWVSGLAPLGYTLLLICGLTWLHLQAVQHEAMLINLHLLACG